MSENGWQQVIQISFSFENKQLDAVEHNCFVRQLATHIRLREKLARLDTYPETHFPLEGSVDPQYASQMMGLDTQTSTCSSVGTDWLTERRRAEKSQSSTMA